MGSFSGTLNQAGTAYNGTLHITEAGNSVNGTMTFTIDSPNRLTVTYHQDNGVGGSFTLENLTTKPTVSGTASVPAVNFTTHCFGTGLCAYNAIAIQADPQIVGSLHFSVKPGHTRKISLSLSKKGRKLLAKRGSLRVRVQLALKKSSGLPQVTNVGTVTFHKKH